MRQLLTQMSPVTAYIEQKNMAPKGHDKRQTQNLKPPLFYSVMPDTFSIEAEKAKKTIALHGQIVGSQLQLHLPAAESHEHLYVNDNEIILDNLRLRLVIDLDDDPNAPF